MGIDTSKCPIKVSQVKKHGSIFLQCAKRGNAWLLLWTGYVIFWTGLISEGFCCNPQLLEISSLNPRSWLSSAANHALRYSLQKADHALTITELRKIKDENQFYSGQKVCMQEKRSQQFAFASDECSGICLYAKTNNETMLSMHIDLPYLNGTQVWSNIALVWH